VSEISNFETYRRKSALLSWLNDCRDKMALRFPNLDFDANHWPIRTKYQTQQADWNFGSQLKCFVNKNKNFSDALRCLTAEMVLTGNPKTLFKPVSAFRRLADTECESLFDLTLKDIRRLEENDLVYCRSFPIRSNTVLDQHTNLTQQLAVLAEKGVIPTLGYFMRSQVKSELSKLNKSTKETKSGDLLDLKMEALNDAFNAMTNSDPRINAADKVAICTMVRKLCAPSRINEVLCSSIEDVVTLEDYTTSSKAGVSEDTAHDIHKLLLVTMKGSKGAQWSAKPILNFMIDAFNYANEVIKENGSRSRMLANWYRKHPNKVYLPVDLEHLRGKPVSRADVSSIMHLDKNHRNGNEARVTSLFVELKNLVFKGRGLKITQSSDCQKNFLCSDFVPWSNAETVLIRHVHSAIEECRKVTHENHYDGDVSKMLYLFDRKEHPYLPYAANARFIRERLKRPNSRENHKPLPTVFDKLGITIPINGKIEFAQIDTHDARRWLTTMALRHGEKLSDVLINKWANRLSLPQLKAYDFRSDEEKAYFSKMPDIPVLMDLSNGISPADKLNETYGLKADVVVVHNAGISVTSLQRILEAVEDRPIAKTSEQIIIIYPSIYGACLHQHHETPCRRYSRCLTCNENVCVKGHIETNDQIRKDEKTLTASILRQVETMIASYNRGIADYPSKFEEHLIKLVEKGICSGTITSHLIDEFHQIKDTIVDKLMRMRLEEAFVARGYLHLLDDDEVAVGALMKYRNPRQHAAPGLEIAMDSHGGREKIAEDEKVLVQKHPAFAPVALNLRDERHRIEENDDEEGN
jgi:hypothetical protein